MRDGQKLFKDPIYDLIYFDKIKDAPILKIIESDEFQRLRRIRQLGLSSYTYSSSNHDRFSHSIGVCFLAGLLVDNLNFEKVHVKETGEKIELNKDETKLLIRLAAILHDIGHGPFSHAFERAIKENVGLSLKPKIQIHEDYSIKIINSPAIKNIIEGIDNKKFQKYGVKWITDILAGTFTGSKWVQEIISSQFDADRIDYLLRDAYMCGVKYAGFDWNWIFRNMFIGDILVGKDEDGKEIKTQGILIDGNKGIHSLESFIISRYHMYEQVYFHKTTRGFEAIVNAIFKRLNYLIDNDKMNSSDFLGNYFLDFLKDYDSIPNYLQLDDYYMISHFNHWSQNSRDEILKELCRCFINRKPFKMVDFVTRKDSLSKQRAFSELERTYKTKLGDKANYYCLIDDYANNPYKDTYLSNESSEESKRIWIEIRGKPKDLAEESAIIHPLRNNTFEVSRLYVHRDFL